jgi:hypothetical protein
MPWDFALSDGTHYLPDFYLPTARAWAEIKGDHDQRIEMSGSLLSCGRRALSGAGASRSLGRGCAHGGVVVLSA